MTEYAIKVRKEGECAWYFLTSRGGMNRLRVHAMRFYERETVQTLLDKSAPANPGTEWKVVKLGAA